MLLALQFREEQFDVVRDHPLTLASIIFIIATFVVAFIFLLPFLFDIWDRIKARRDPGNEEFLAQSRFRFKTKQPRITGAALWTVVKGEKPDDDPDREG